MRSVYIVELLRHTAAISLEIVKIALKVDKISALLEKKVAKRYLNFSDII
jgi:hypothetical protein